MFLDFVFLSRGADGVKDGFPNSIGSGVIAGNGLKMETVSILDLLNYITNFEHKEADFLCFAKVIDIPPNNGWNYVACGKCSRKLKKSTDSMYCTYCTDSNPLGVIRVELVVDDETEVANFVAFDQEISRLTNTMASNLIDLKGEDVENTVPHCLLQLVGKTFSFHIRLSS